MRECKKGDVVRVYSECSVIWVYPGCSEDPSGCKGGVAREFVGVEGV